MQKQKAITAIGKLADKMKTRMRSKQAVYQDIVTMCNGRVPVLKCLHVPTNREINLSFTSHSGVNNSFLLKHLISLDARIRPMMVLLKMYFKMKLGKGSLTTFNIYSLIIFALQNEQDPVLPPLHTFLDQSEKAKSALVENRWPVQFQLLPYESKNKKTLIELILDFCSFYANFDFANRLVSPYMGNQGPPITTANYNSFPEFTCEDHEFKFDRAINVQDFFELCMNVGSNCSDFKRICKIHHNHRKDYQKMKHEEELGMAFFARSIVDN